MIRYKLSLIVLALFIISGCASKPLVFSDFDATHNFAKDTSFSWVQDPPMLRSGDYPVSAIAETRMTSAIKNTLEVKGYKFVDNLENADFLVAYTMGARDKIELIEQPNRHYPYYVHWGWGHYYFPYFLHFPFDRHSRHYHAKLPRSYTDGTIAIDIFDTQSKQPVWHSKASKRLSLKDLNSSLDNANEIATQLLKDFPLVGCEPIITDQCQPF